MKKLKKVGFFPSRPNEQEGRNLHAMVQDEPDALEPRILAYLDSGRRYLVDAGIARDLIDPKHPIIGVPNVVTDGVWAWTVDVPYYVRKYHLRLPGEFVEHMQENDWIVPQIGDFKELEL
jgi:hypothetical protein